MAWPSASSGPGMVSHPEEVIRFIQAAADKS